MQHRAILEKAPQRFPLKESMAVPLKPIPPSFWLDMGMQFAMVVRPPCNRTPKQSLNPEPSELSLPQETSQPESLNGSPWD